MALKCNDTRASADGAQWRGLTGISWAQLGSEANNSVMSTAPAGASMTIDGSP
jgi:hypothetical protein